MKRIVLRVEPAGEFERYRGLFGALESLFPASFTAQAQDHSNPPDALIVFGASRESVIAAARRGIHCYAISSASGPALAGHDTAVRFQHSRALAACLRGQTLADPERSEFRPVACEAGEELVAVKAGQPLWVHRPVADGHGGVDFVSFAPPVLSDKAYLAEFLNRACFLRLLPLVNFLKRITENHGWKPAPRRACIVFDDPCLRWTSYGCINFQQLAGHARTWNYHAAIATIPLASGRVCAQNAALFRECSAHLSLVIHGNDHGWHEMARRYPDHERTAILAEALQRVTKMERRHQIAVCRIMESPHGVIDQGMSEPLVALGYEGALLTPLQFLRCNREAAFSTELGLGAAECLSGGLCMLPRIKATPNWKTDALLAALLNQPVVIVGHHYDAANGMEMMKDMANTINGLGSVRWTSLTGIARSQYQTRSDGRTLTVRLGSRRIVLPVPEGIQGIAIERPWLTNEETEPLIVKSLGGTATEKQLVGGPSERIVSPGPGMIEIVSPVARAMNPAEVPARPQRLWPLIRHALMESRDRAYPFLRPFSQ